MQHHCRAVVEIGHGVCSEVDEGVVGKFLLVVGELLVEACHRTDREATMEPLERQIEASAIYVVIGRVKLIVCFQRITFSDGDTQHTVGSGVVTCGLILVEGIHILG